MVRLKRKGRRRKWRKRDRIREESKNSRKEKKNNSLINFSKQQLFLGPKSTKLFCWHNFIISLFKVSIQCQFWFFCIKNPPVFEVPKTNVPGPTATVLWFTTAVLPDHLTALCVPATVSGCNQTSFRLTVYQPRSLNT